MNTRRDLLRALVSAPGIFNVRDPENPDEWDKRGEEVRRAYLYSSGYWGPTYCFVKGAVSFPFFQDLCDELAGEIQDVAPQVDFVAANVTGGMVPSIHVANRLADLRGHHVPIVYIRESRKLGGLREHVTGLTNPDLTPGRNALIGEELTTYANTTSNSAVLMRDLGFQVTHCMAIVAYNHEPGRAALAAHDLTQVRLYTMSDVVDMVEELGLKSPRHIQVAREYLADPDAWQARYGFERVVSGGTK